MSEQSSLEKYRQDLSHCVKCGSCSAVCPSFLAERSESFSPRGRMALIRAVLDNRFPASELYMNRLASCTTCLACEAACPGNVPVTRIIQAAKEQAIAGTGRGIIASVVAKVVKHPTLFRAAAWFAPVVLHYERRMRNAEFGVRNNKAAKQKRKGTVVFYPGCAIEHVQPEIGRATINVFGAMGYEVVIPEGLQCCGRPLLSLGDRKAAEEAAEHNAALFRSFDADEIVTSCASCSLTFKNEYPALLRPGTDMPAVIDVHEFLASRLDQSMLAPVRKNITWHDPCHLGRGIGLSRTARDILRLIPGTTFTEMRDADRCCGFGGVMRITHRGLSDKIVADKVRNIRATGASTVVTGCPGCRMQIADALQRAGSFADVVHTVQLLEEALLNAECGVRNAELETTETGYK